VAKTSIITEVPSIITRVTKTSRKVEGIMIEQKQMVVVKHMLTDQKRNQIIKQQHGFAYPCSVLCVYGLDCV